MEDTLLALEAWGADRQLRLWSTYFAHCQLTAANQTLLFIGLVLRSIIVS